MSLLLVEDYGKSFFWNADERGFARITADFVDKKLLLYPRWSALIRTINALRWRALVFRKQSRSFFLNADERGSARIRADFACKHLLLYPRSSAFIRAINPLRWRALVFRKQSRSFFLNADERGSARIRADFACRHLLLYPRSSAFIRVPNLFAFLTVAPAS